ncbi:MAG: hypothetical protein LKM36_15425 [Flavobacteriales bacterium]|jgi:predicted Zn-dependent protease|nr:hypothetical protein [Flavobacteriales bacterium]MCI1754192.1 hypothetical protein [Flavobacteriales bacterium]
MRSAPIVGLRKFQAKAPIVPEPLRAMANDRLAQLRSMLEEEPGDKFLRYAVALEHKRVGDMEEAATDLEALLLEDPAYIACYYQLALVLADLGRTSDAVDACRAGALKCLVTGDRKARSELLALAAGLTGEEDE